MRGSSKKPGWFMGCGRCDGALYVRNAAIVREGSTCSNCEKMGTPGDDFAGGDPSDNLVSTELGWCGCGSPEDVDQMMAAYLDARAVDGFPKPHPEGVSEDAELLLSYIADDLGWTTHGGSVGGAWLTPDGEEARANLRAAVAAWIAADEAEFGPSHSIPHNPGEAE